jgi:hypothetical protein
MKFLCFAIKKVFFVLAQVIVLWLMGLSPLKFILKGYCGAKSKNIKIKILTVLLILCFSVGFSTRVAFLVVLNHQEQKNKPS